MLTNFPYLSFFPMFDVVDCVAVYGHPLLDPKVSINRLRLVLSMENGTVVFCFSTFSRGINIFEIDDVGVDERRPRVVNMLFNVASRRI